VEQVRFKSGMEERGSDGWCDVCFRWWMSLRLADVCSSWTPLCAGEAFCLVSRAVGTGIYRQSWIEAPACNRGPTCINASEVQQTDGRQHVRPGCLDICPFGQSPPEKEAPRTTAHRTHAPSDKCPDKCPPLRVWYEIVQEQMLWAMAIFTWKCFIFIYNIIQKYTT